MAAEFSVEGEGLKRRFLQDTGTNGQRRIGQLMMVEQSPKLLATQQEKALQEEGQNVDLDLFSFHLMMST